MPTLFIVRPSARVGVFGSSPDSYLLFFDNAKVQCATGAAQDRNRAARFTESGEGGHVKQNKNNVNKTG